MRLQSPISKPGRPPGRRAWALPLLALAHAASLGAPCAAARPQDSFADVKFVRSQMSLIHNAIQRRRLRWALGETSLARLSPISRRRRLGLLPPRPRTAADPPQLRFPWSKKERRQSPPASFDWRLSGGANYVTPVRDQGGCKSCWAFSTTGALESYVLRTRGADREAPDLAEQTLLSCADAGTCEEGGFQDEAMRFIEKVGLPEEASHPYASLTGECGALGQGWEASARRVGRWLRVDQNVDAIKAALVEHGPLPTTMAIFTDFWFYGGGVYARSTGTLEGFHAVLLVGYDDAEGAFTVKNSWGEGWGEDGYFRIAYSEVANEVRFGADTLALSTAAVSPVTVEITRATPARRDWWHGPLGLSAVEGTVASRARGTPVTELVFKLGDEAVGLMTHPQQRWRVPLDTSGLSNGRHTLTALAFDQAGNGARASLRFNIRSAAGRASTAFAPQRERPASAEAPDAPAQGEPGDEYVPEAGE
ncbi:MAG: C1 family peptidase [Elusimicrobia bacterium]|nr:C1 family peptidase [Elusimicrobiota bacterium]